MAAGAGSERGGRAVDDFSSGATPLPPLPPGVPRGTPREDEYATPGKAVDFDYYLGGLDLDDLLTRLEKNEVHNGLVTPSMNTPVAQGGEGAAEIRQDGDVGGRLEDEAMEEPKDAEPSGVGNVPAEDGEDFSGAHDAGGRGGRERVRVFRLLLVVGVRLRRSVPPRGRPVGRGRVLRRGGGGVHLCPAAWPQRTSPPRWRRCTRGSPSDLRALALPGRFYHMPGEVGLLLRVTRNNNPDECALGLRDKGLHRFPASREVEDAGSAWERRMSAARLSALPLNSHCRGAAPNNASPSGHSHWFCPAGSRISWFLD